MCRTSSPGALVALAAIFVVTVAFLYATVPGVA